MCVCLGLQPAPLSETVDNTGAEEGSQSQQKAFQELSPLPSPILSSPASSSDEDSDSEEEEEDMSKSSPPCW